MIDKETKKILIEQMLSINYMLDTYRTSLTLLINNIYSNEKLKKLPEFKYDELKKVCFAIAELLNGSKVDYEKILTEINTQYFKNASAKNVIDPTDKLKKQDDKDFEEKSKKAKNVIDPTDKLKKQDDKDFEEKSKK